MNELQNRQAVQHVGFDRSELFRLRRGRFQNFGEELPERGVLRRRRFLQILAVDQRDVHRLADQIEQIFPRKFDESRAQKNVIMDVVDSERQSIAGEYRRSRAQASSGPDGRAPAQFSYLACGACC